MNFPDKPNKERHGTYDLSTVFDWVELSNVDSLKLKQFEGLDVLSSLLGYTVFKQQGTKCKCCPTEGTYFALEKTPGPGRSKFNNWHFNLYGKNHIGVEVMLTKDHIKPKSAGGSDALTNLQPMCEPCNTNKGSMHMEEFMALNSNENFVWDFNKAQHVIRRLKERYSLVFTMDEYKKFLRLVKTHGEIMHIVSGSKTYRKIHYRNTDIYVVYSTLYKAIYTVLDPKHIEESMMDVPVWGNGQEKHCLDLYEEIMETVKTQYKEFATKKETAEYFARHCTYPKIMFSYYDVQKLTGPKEAIYLDNRSRKLNLLVWLTVKNKLIKQKEQNEKECNSRHAGAKENNVGVRA